MSRADSMSWVGEDVGTGSVGLSAPPTAAAGETVGEAIGTVVGKDGEAEGLDGAQPAVPSRNVARRMRGNLVIST